MINLLYEKYGKFVISIYQLLQKFSNANYFYYLKLDNIILNTSRQY